MYSAFEWVVTFINALFVTFLDDFQHCFFRILKPCFIARIRIDHTRRQVGGNVFGTGSHVDVTTVPLLPLQPCYATLLLSPAAYLLDFFCIRSKAIAKRFTKTIAPCGESGPRVHTALVGSCSKHEGENITGLFASPISERPE